MASAFSGFPAEGMRFLEGLKKHNNREWFQERKQIFDEKVKAPMELLVDGINAKLAKFAPQYITEPKKAIYRIYRDTRFSKDKTPYKTHIAAGLNRAGLERHISAGYYFSVSPEEIEVAAGVYMPGPEQLRALRDHITANHEEMREMLARPAVKKLMGELHGEAMARVPKGYVAEHPAADLVRRKHWVFYHTRMDKALVSSPKLLGELVKRFECTAPFVEFLNRPYSVKRSVDPLRMSW